MNSVAFMASLSRLIGERQAERCAARIGRLDERLHHSMDILGYEALAFYSTGMGWYDQINAELWSGRPSDEVAVFSAVLNQGLAKLPTYRGNNGTIFRGFTPPNLATFLTFYKPGGKVRFPAFTSASLQEDMAFGGSVLFIIRSLTARVVWFLAADFNEHEVLMPTDCVFEVVSVDVVDQRAAIVLQELSP